MDFTKRYEKLIEQFGSPGTTGLVPGDFLVEECSELIQAIQHYKRNRDNAYQEVVNEMADVYVLMDCVKRWLNISDAEIQEYQTRLIDRYLGQPNDGRHIASLVNQTKEG